MNIQEWFTTGSDYKKGVELYALVPYCNKHLLRIFNGGETHYNREKLKTELRKFIHTPITLNEIPDYQVKTFTKHEQGIEVEIHPKPEFNKKPISFYPLELHPIYKKRIESFYEACTLKTQLNNLPEESEKEALELQFKIYQCWKVNDRSSLILRHYEQTKRIMPFETKEDFSGLSPQELVNKRQKLYSRISKRKSTLLALDNRYKSCPEGASKVSLLNKINQKKEEMQQLNLQVEALTNKIEYETYR